MQNKIRPYLILTLFCIILFVSGQTTIPPFDRDEALFAQASRQMIETGDYIDIRFQDRTRYKKPIGIYWLQVAAAKLSGESADRRAGDNPIWPYRLPSVIGAVIAVLITYGIGRRLFGHKEGLIGAGMLATSLLLNVEARMAKTDAFLLASICAAQASLGHIYLSAKDNRPTSWKPALLFWTSVGIGVLIKGPVILLVSGLTIITLLIADRKTVWISKIHPVAGICVAALIIMPWLAAITLRTNNIFLQESITKDLLPKLFSGHEMHGAPPGFYIATFAFTFWPGSLIAWLSIAWIWRNRRQPNVLFCLAWIVPAWLVMEIVPTKLLHYTLPTFPAIAVLSAKGLSSYVPESKIIPFLLWGISSIILIVALIGIPVAADGEISTGGVIAAIAVLAIIYYGGYGLWRGKFNIKATIIMLCIFYISAFGLLVPEMKTPWLSRQISEKLPPGHHQVAIVGYHEPSIVFLLGTDTKLAGVEQAVQHLLEHPDNIAIISEKYRESFLERVPHARAIADIRGFNYNKGKYIDLIFYRQK
ncbi:MAG: glycosyltransferase family 39 protein [Candidatus Mariimomonas ferrooxydans]